MKNKLIIFTGIIAFGASLQAGTTYNLDITTTSSAGLTMDAGWAISPYSGTLNGTPLSLYCDDFNDNVYYGQQNISVYATALPATTNTTFQNDTRYAVNNPSTAGAGYPAGTQLYDEMAWLVTQMRNTSGANATGNDIAIQEAIWTLTNDKNVNDGSSPHNETTTGTGALGDSGAQQSYLAWIADAASDYNQTNVSGYVNLTASDWYILTAVGSAGCTVGAETNGCSGSGGTGAGTAGTGTVTQEFLVYSAGPIVPTPEPGSFFLIGSGLVFGAYVGRKRMSGKSKQ